MSTELANIKPSEEMIFAPENLTKETIKKYLCPKASDQELLMGLQIAKTFGLNPLKRELYFVKYKDDEPMQVLTGYEVYLKRAERSGKYSGLKVWTEGSVAGGNLKGCVEVYVKGWDKPLYHEADYLEYVQMKNVYEGFGNNKKYVGKEPNTFWKNKPKTMIKKVAVSQAFRWAFPDEFEGMPYTRDEVIDVEASEKAEIKPEIEMPKLKAPATAPEKAIEQPQKPLEAPKAIEAEVSSPKAKEPPKSDLKPVLSLESVKKINIAAKNIGVEALGKIIAGFGFKSIDEIPSDEMAMKIYNASKIEYAKRAKK